MIRVARLGLGRDGVGIQLLPLIQFVIQGDRHGIALADLVIAHGGATVPVDETVPGEHT